MFHRPLLFSTCLIGTALFATGCSVAPPMNAQETQIQTDLSVDQYMPATRQMRDAIETQELFAQAAFWSNEYNLNPGDLEAALKLSAAVRKMGNPGRAVEITQTTRALYPSDPYLMAEYAAALIASERALDAIPILNEGLSKTPSYGRLWSLKGAALDQQERYAEARQHYDRALRITPNDANVMANMGLSHALAGDSATAEQWLRRATSMPNASDSVRQNLILVLQLQGKTAEANKLAGMTRPQMSFPKTRPAFNRNQKRECKWVQSKDSLFLAPLRRPAPWLQSEANNLRQRVRMDIYSSRHPCSPNRLRRVIQAKGTTRKLRRRMARQHLLNRKDVSLIVDVAKTFQLPLKKARKREHKKPVSYTKRVFCYN